ncbi:MAG TPA: LPS assembly lipoprotein LptE [Alphaproteobacteria bacterium]|nr:LPS assembly lipoprotein LptE [Alphaproteobacteria bacterium]
MPTLRLEMRCRFFVLLILLAASPLAACGFQPLYARNGDSGVPEELMRVQIGEIRDPAPNVLSGFRRGYDTENDRSRQLLRNFLTDDLATRGGTARRDYVLNIQVFEPRTNVAIDRSDTTLRYGYSVIAYFQLHEGSGRNVFAGTSTSSTTFAVSQSEFATIASQRDARERAMQEISADIRNQLAAYFFTQARRASAQ